MADLLKSLTRAFTSLFRQMRQLADDGDKERFGDWVHRIRDGIVNIIANGYAQQLTKNRGRTDPDEILAVAQQRAITTARDICSTTTDWLQEGRDTSSVFSVERAVKCALTEASYVINEAKAVACKQRGRKVRWRLGGKGCKECRKLNGKVFSPGKHPPIPAHPHCMCKLVEVRWSSRSSRYE